MKRFKKFAYTFKHKKAILDIEKKLLGKNTMRGYLHDMDKLFLYPILGVKLTSKIHRKTSRHHINKAHTNKDYLEMVIDWESARFTKPDKPLNARQTLYKFYPQLEDKILPILNKYNL